MPGLPSSGATSISSEISHWLSPPTTLVLSEFVVSEILGPTSRRRPAATLRESSSQWSRNSTIRTARGKTRSEEELVGKPLAHGPTWLESLQRLSKQNKRKGCPGPLAASAGAEC